MKKGKWILRTVMIALFLAGIFGMQAQAVLDLTFSSDIKATKGRIQFYWATEATSANLPGYSVSDAGLPLDLTTNKAVADAADPKLIHFGCDDVAFPNSVKAYVRVWDSEAKNNIYTAISTPKYDNSAAGVVDDTFDINYVYIKAVPATPFITQYTQNGTTYINPPANPSVTVTFASASDKVNGYTVEVPTSKWELNQGGVPVIVPGSGTSLTLDTNNPPAGITMNSGDKIDIRVKHVNLWGQESANWSSSYQYTVGATGGGGGGPLTKTWNLKQPAGLTGINTISLPYDMTKVINNDGNGLTSSIDENNDAKVTVAELIKSINDQAATSTVMVFGWYDESTQKHVGLTSVVYAAGVIDQAASTATGKTVAEVLAEPIVNSRCYQVSVRNDNINYSLKGTAQ